MLYLEEYLYIIKWQYMYMAANTLDLMHCDFSSTVVVDHIII